MSDQPQQPAPQDSPARRERRRRVQEVFGDVLPDITEDEQSGDDNPATDAASDRWLRDQVPPHHG